MIDAKWHFFNFVLLHENFCILIVDLLHILIQISLKFDPEDPNNNVDTIIGLDNGFTLDRWQSITWTNDGLE